MYLMPLCCIYLKSKYSLTPFKSKARDCDTSSGSYLSAKLKCVKGRCHGFDNKLRAALNSSTVHRDRVDSTHNTRRSKGVAADF
jgi:hypothetical protein